MLLTLASEVMAQDKKVEFQNKLNEYNLKNNVQITHINTTFEGIANAIRENIDDRDYEMHEILDDYLNYCYESGLIPVNDSWMFMRVQLAGTTIEFNKKENIYYDKAERGFRPHDYLGLYNNKSVRVVGKVIARITAVLKDNEMQYDTELGELTEERKQKILMAIEDAKRYGYSIEETKHRYFFVDNFYETDFKKITPRAPMGSRIFNLTEILGREDWKSSEEIAKRLSEKTWS